MARGQDLTASDWNRFAQSGRNAIALATILGWKVHWNSSNKNTAILQNGAKKIVVPTTNINANRARSWIKQILTASDADQIVQLAEGTLNLRDMPEEVQRVVATMGTALNQYAMSFAEQRQLIKEESVLTHKVGEAVEQQPAPVEQQPPQQSVTQRHTEDDEDFEQFLEELDRIEVVKTEPLLARQRKKKGGSGDMYESKGIEVVTLSDSTQFFRCKFCTYVNANKLSVRSHLNSNHRGMATPDFAKKEEPVPAAEPAQPATKADAIVSLHGIELLTHQVREGLRPNGQARDVSVHLLQLPFDQRAKIAHIILNGKDVETLRTAAEEAIAEAKSERDSALAKADAATQRADALESDLSALRDMIQGLGNR